MAKTDVFALAQSGMNPFLLSDVGLEANGSPLTVLSMLARLGEDPWGQALLWNKLPKSAVKAFLVSRIREMPLSEQALDEAETTASSIVQRLPGTGSGGAAPGVTQAGRPAGPGATKPGTDLVPHSTRMIIFYCVFAIGLALNMVFGKFNQDPHVIPSAVATPGTVVPVAPVATIPPKPTL